jgi:hypothetical protein
VIIGLGYRARAGKDTVADHLVRGHGFTRVAFADNLKTAARAIFHLTDEQLYGDRKELIDPRWGLTPRDILQRLGTEGVRNVFGSHVWRKSLFLGLEPGRDYVVTDVRFPDEVQEVKDAGGVGRPGRPPRPPGHLHDRAPVGERPERLPGVGHGPREQRHARHALPTHGRGPEDAPGR